MKTSPGVLVVLEIDTLGTFQMSRAAHSYLKGSGSGGCIVNISATLHYGATFYQVLMCRGQRLSSGFGRAARTRLDSAICLPPLLQFTFLFITCGL